MRIIPLQATAFQDLTVQLADQVCQITIRQKALGLFLDLAVNNTNIVAGVICQNLNKMVRSVYLGFTGDLCFIDLQGTDDPVYTGLGSRFVLAYLESSDLT